MSKKKTTLQDQNNVFTRAKAPYGAANWQLEEKLTKLSEQKVKNRR